MLNNENSIIEPQNEINFILQNDNLEIQAENFDINNSISQYSSKKTLNKNKIKDNKILNPKEKKKIDLNKYNNVNNKVKINYKHKKLFSLNLNLNDINKLRNYPSKYNKKTKKVNNDFHKFTSKRSLDNKIRKKLIFKDQKKNLKSNKDIIKNEEDFNYKEVISLNKEISKLFENRKLLNNNKMIKIKKLLSKAKKEILN